MADKDTKKRKGKIKRALGWATGDRQVEAEGAVEAATGREPNERERKVVEHIIRDRHNDFSRR